MCYNDRFGKTSSRVNALKRLTRGMGHLRLHLLHPHGTCCTLLQVPQVETINGPLYCLLCPLHPSTHMLNLLSGPSLPASSPSQNRRPSTACRQPHTCQHTGGASEHLPQASPKCAAYACSRAACRQRAAHVTPGKRPQAPAPLYKQPPSTNPPRATFTFYSTAVLNNPAAPQAASTTRAAATCSFRAARSSPSSSSAVCSLQQPVIPLLAALRTPG